MNHFISLERRDVQEKLASLERFEKVKYLAPTDLNLVSLAKASISISMVRHFVLGLFDPCLKVRHPFERLVSAYQNKVGSLKKDVSQWAIYEITSDC